MIVACQTPKALSQNVRFKLAGKNIKGFVFQSKLKKSLSFENVQFGPIQITKHCQGLFNGNNSLWWISLKKTINDYYTFNLNSQWFNLWCSRNTFNFSHSTIQLLTKWLFNCTAASSEVVIKQVTQNIYAIASVVYTQIVQIIYASKYSVVIANYRYSSI